MSKGSSHAQFPVAEVTKPQTIGPSKVITFLKYQKLERLKNLSFFSCIGRLEKFHSYPNG